MRQSAFLLEEALHPLERFVAAVLGLQEYRVVVEYLRRDVVLHHFFKKSCGLLSSAGCGVSSSEKHSGAIEIHLGVATICNFQVGDGSRGIAKLQGALATAVESTRRIAFGGDGAIKSFARLGVLFLVPIKLAKFLKICDGGIVHNHGFHELNPSLAAMALKHGADQARVGQNFGNDVNHCSDGSANENDPNPIPFAAAAEKMDQGKNLEDESPRIEEMADKTHEGAAPGPERSVGLLRDDVDVDRGSLAKEAIHGGHINPFTPAVDGRPAENHLSDVLFVNESGHGIGDIIALQAGNGCSQAFGELNVGFESFLVVGAPVLADIYVDSVEFRVNAAGHAGGASD